MSLFRLLFVTYAVAQIYIFIGFYRAFGKKWWLLPLGLLQLVCTVSIFYRLGQSGGYWFTLWQIAGYVWMGFAVLVAMFWLVTDAWLLLRLLIQKSLWQSFARSYPARKCVRFAFWLACICFVYSSYAAYSPNVIKVNLTSAAIPAGSKPLRIVQITDVHVHATIGPLYLQRVADIVTELAPDVLVSTGDLVDTNTRDRAEDAAILATIPAPLGKFAVLGNHEKYQGVAQSINFTEKAGFTVLRDTAVTIGGVTLVGVDDRTLRKYAVEEEQVEKRLLGSMANNTFVMLLKHQPSVIKSSIGRFDIQISGHTHNGQIWPGPYVVQRVHKYVHGQYTVANSKGEKSQLFISSGVGFWGPPLRFLTRPEIIEYTISPQP